MTLPAFHLALMSELPGAAGATAPDWVHLLPAPADGLVRTGDKRGPYTLAPFAEIIAATFADRDAIEVDLNHSTFLAAPRGERSDAMGWVRELQARQDGLWGRVEWTEEGERLVSGRAYRGISPVVRHDTNKKIFGLANVSLVNRPNLRGLTALHSEEARMGMMERLIEMLGLGAGATEEQVMAALEGKLKSKGDDTVAAMQAQIGEIGVALGVAGGDAAAIVAAAKSKAAAVPAEIVALQSQLATMATQLNAVTEAGAREKAVAFVDGAIRQGRAGLPPAMRDRYISMHMQDPAQTEEIVSAMPMVSGGTVRPATPAKDGVIALQAEDLQIANMLGLTAEAYTAERKAEAALKEAL